MSDLYINKKNMIILFSDVAYIFSQSISFHENGKRHKENVHKHISQLSKKSAKEFKQKEKMDDDIKKMEKAAMAAYLKDVQNNADLTSQVFIRIFCFLAIEVPLLNTAWTACLYRVSFTTTAKIHGKFLLSCRN